MASVRLSARHINGFAARLSTDCSSIHWILNDEVAIWVETHFPNATVRIGPDPETGTSAFWLTLPDDAACGFFVLMWG